MYRPTHKNSNSVRDKFERNKATISQYKNTIQSKPLTLDDVFVKHQPYEKPLYLKMRKRPQDYFDESMMWIGNRYIINNIAKRNLTVGDLVFLHPAPGSSNSTLVCIVWYQKKKVDSLYESFPFNNAITEDASKYSLIIKTLEGRPKGFQSSDGKYWSTLDTGFSSIHENDEWLNDTNFTRLEPVQWWIGKNATTKSSEFKAMAAVLNIHESIYKDLP